MLIGTLALTGFPFLSGYYSKDAIIEFAYHKQSAIGYYVCAVGIITAFLTSIYSWRLMFKTFHGSYNNDKLNKDSIHESSLIMIIPLILLTIIASINFQGFIDHYKSIKRIKVIIIGIISILAIFLFNHSRIWRQHLIENQDKWAL